MGGQEDSLGSFFYYVLFVYPVTSWFLKPGRFTRRNGILLAIGFLSLLAALKTGMEVYERGPNFYQLMGVGRASSPLDIKKAYKKMSLELHPDKNKSPTAAEDFARLKDAYDALMDPELRQVYNKFGEDGIKHNRRFDEGQMLLEIAVYYATWGMLAFVLTLGKASASARQWIFTGQIVMLIAEVSLMLQETKLPDWFVPWVTEHELVALLHSLFPAYMNGCRCLGGHLYVDLEEQNRQMMLSLQEQNKDILLVLRDIQVNLQSLQVSAGKSGGAVVSTGSSGSGTPVPKVTPTGKLKELEEKIRLSKEAGGAGGSKTSPAAVSSGQAASFGVWGAIGLYILFHFIFAQ